MAAPQLLSSCSSVKISDKEFCVDQGTLGGHCAHMFTTETRNIPQPDWDNFRFGQICTIDPADNLGDTFARMKNEIEELCSICNCCSYPEIKKTIKFLNEFSDNQRKHIGQDR